MNHIAKIWELTFRNFFLIAFAAQVIYLAGYDFYLYQLFMVSCLVYGGYILFNFKFRSICDYFVLIYLIYIILNTIFIDYPLHWRYAYKAMLIQFAPILCYFIGRNSRITIEHVFSNMKYPLLLAAIIGLYAFFFNPSWYVDMKTSNFSKYITDIQIEECMRLSSVWTHPYRLSYATILYCMLLFNDLYKKRKGSQKWHILLQLVILVIVLLFAQLRVTLICLIVSNFVFLVYYGYSLRKIFFQLFLILLFCGVSLFAVTNFATQSNSAYLSHHLEAVFKSETYDERFKVTENIESIFGDGFGRYDYLAIDYHKPAILDNELYNHIGELGYIGTFLLISILLISLYRIIFSRVPPLESSVFLFYLIAMFVASVLSNHHQYNYVFWFVLGHIWSKRTFLWKKEITWKNLLSA